MDTTCASLFYNFPENLIATQPQQDFRILSVKKGAPREVTKAELFDGFTEGDLLVINNTRVNKQRVFTQCGLEVLFIRQLAPHRWEVLFPARRMKSETVKLPNGIEMRLISKGLPQTVELSEAIDDLYFEAHGELALPPYIQKARGVRGNVDNDESWYQTAWAESSGSVAAPTASLHFNNQDLKELQNRGVNIAKVTLHVGLGTFLPIKTKKLSDHVMHKEYCEIPLLLKDQVEETRQRGNKVWALGTTVARSLESLYADKLHESGDKYVGETDLFITPGFEFKAVNALMTNFHQPESTLLALVAAFAGLENVLEAYKFAIEKQFRLFSYGDLSVWTD